MPVRFRFCGDAEVPDWILASVHDISSQKIGQLRRLVRNVVEAILEGNGRDAGKDGRVDLPVESVEDEGRAATVNYILRNAISHEVTEATLSNELQQIGLAHEHAVCFCQVYTQHVAELKSKAEKQSLRCSLPKNVLCQRKDGDAAAEPAASAGGALTLHLEVWQAASRALHSYKITLTEQQAQLLVQELSCVLEQIQIVAN